MFSTYLRAAVELVFAVLLMAILGFVLQFFIPGMGAEDALLRQTFEAVRSWGLFLMIVAVLFGIVYRAVVESRVGGVRR